MEGKKEIGNFGEKIACEYLKSKGYRVLENNYRIRGGEIDIVAREGRIIVFVEVKTRTSRMFGFPEEAIDHRKQRKLALAAEYYLAAHRLYDEDYRIDSIGIEIDRTGKVNDLKHEKDIVGW